MQTVPDFDQLSQYVVNRAGDWEGLKWSLYDTNTYPIAGATTLNFFSTPIGQGVGFGGGVKTLSDTNMNLAGQLPANQAFLITSVEVQFWPVTPTVAAQMPSNTSQLTAGAVAQGLINDTYIFYRAGNLTLNIGSKDYVATGPLINFAPKQYFEVDSAIGATGDSDLTEAVSVKTGFARPCGRPYMLDPANLLLQSNQNFALTLSWPEGLQPITTAQGGSNAPARVRVVLDGFLYRVSQ